METELISESKVDGISSEGNYNGSTTSLFAAFAGLAAATAAAPSASVVSEIDVDNNNDPDAAAGDDGTVKPPATRTSLSSIGSMLTRRKYASHVSTPAGSGDNPSQPSLTIQDVKKFVFQVSRTDKRLVSGLRAHAFSNQAFFSSFAVGLAIGSVVAILFRILYEVGFRVLPFNEK